MMPISTADREILIDGRFQETPRVAARACLGPAGASCCRANSGLAVRVSPQSDDSRRYVNPSQHRRGAEPAEREGIQSIPSVRAGLKLRARVPSDHGPGLRRALLRT